MTLGLSAAAFDVADRIALLSPILCFAGVTGRSLSQVQLGASAMCPEGCDRPNGGCVQDNTMAGLRCQKCLGNLFVNKVCS
jgi:hypothetical protein